MTTWDFTPRGRNSFKVNWVNSAEGVSDKGAARKKKVNNPDALPAHEVFADIVEKLNFGESGESIAKQCFQPVSRVVERAAKNSVIKESDRADFARRLSQVLASRNVFYPVQVLALKPEELSQSLDGAIRISDNERQAVDSVLAPLKDAIGNLHGYDAHIGLCPQTVRLPQYQLVLASGRDQGRAYSPDKFVAYNQIEALILQRLKEKFGSKKIAAEPVSQQYISPDVT